MTPLQELLSELSFRSGLSIPEIEKELKKWWKKAESNSADESAAISGVGTFTVNQNGSITFTADSLLMDLVNYQYIGLAPLSLHNDLLGSVPVAPDRDTPKTNSPSPVSTETTQPKKSEKSSKSSGSVQVQSAKSKKKPILAVGLLLVMSFVATVWFMAPNLAFLDFMARGDGDLVENSKAIESVDSPSSEVSGIGTEPTVSLEESDALATTLSPSSDLIPEETASQELSLYGLFGEFNEELSGSFTISVFSFSDIDNASEKASVLLSEGYRLNIRTVWNGGGTIWQLTVGQFESREEAESALESLSKTQFSESTIISYP